MGGGGYVLVAAIAPVEFHEGDVVGGPSALRADTHPGLGTQFIYHIVDDLGHGSQGEEDQCDEKADDNSYDDPYQGTWKEDEDDAENKGKNGSHQQELEDIIHLGIVGVLDRAGDGGTGIRGRDVFSHGFTAGYFTLWYSIRS